MTDMSKAPILSSIRGAFIAASTAISTRAWLLVADDGLGEYPLDRLLMMPGKRPSNGWDDPGAGGRRRMLEGVYRQNVQSSGISGLMKSQRVASCQCFPFPRGN